MKNLKLFVGYAYCLHSPYSVSDATEKITGMVERSRGEMRLKRMYFDTAQNILITTHPGYRNSYAPVIHVRVEEEDNASLVSVSFELTQGTKLFALAFNIAALVCEVSLLIQLIAEKSELWLMNFLPIGLVAVNYLLCTLGLYVSSQRIYEKLRRILGA